MKHKINSLRARMKDNNVDIVALGPGTHMKWLLGINTHADERPCMLLIGKEKEAFLDDDYYYYKEKDTLSNILLTFS